jgi:hypothetical protein
MKKVILILILLTQFEISASLAQNLTLDYIYTYLKAVDSTYKVELVKSIHINGDDYGLSDDSLFLSKLKEIPIDRINIIGYSTVMTDNYVPGVGVIWINTTHKQTINEIKESISYAIKEFSNGKKPVLVINKKPVDYINLKEELNKTPLTEIYEIYVSSFPVPVSIYGQNGKNGIIRIWTINNIEN